MNVLVTGHRGLVGGAVSEALEARGDTVLGYDLLDGHDLLDAPTLASAAAAADVIVHLAAVEEAPPDVDLPDELLPRSQAEPERVTEVIVDGTVNVLEAARAADTPASSS